MGNNLATAIALFAVQLILVIFGWRHHAFDTEKVVHRATKKEEGHPMAVERFENESDAHYRLRQYRRFVQQQEETLRRYERESTLSTEELNRLRQALNDQKQFMERQQRL